MEVLTGEKISHFAHQFLHKSPGFRDGVVKVAIQGLAVPQRQPPLGVHLQNVIQMGWRVNVRYHLDVVPGSRCQQVPHIVLAPMFRGDNLRVSFGFNPEPHAVVHVELQGVQLAVGHAAHELFSPLR